MYSSEELERFYFLYMVEAQPRGKSIEQFCKEKKVPYKLFTQWLDAMHKKAAEEQAQGRLSTDKDARIQQLLQRNRERELDLRARDLVLEDMISQLKDIQKRLKTAKSDSGTAGKELEEASQKVIKSIARAESLKREIANKKQELSEFRKQQSDSDKKGK